ncbi:MULTISPECIES: hypothetical protein [Burkholderia]|uniref:hypothetical protein n=1 Tax=Burkholderia TaxID=32008 RepID=UPI00157B941A|nr:MULTISPECIES: hypothetical protein [Burkholderia]MCU9952099.1 hypothetical protein [Burkholderia sp. BKH01]NTY37439.1 hypothetical protein [Burkholderia diffusa]
MESDVLVFGKAEFVHWLGHLSDDYPLRGVVSIGDPGSMAPEAIDTLRCPVLRLEFLDRYDACAVDGKPGPSSVHVMALPGFARRLQGRTGAAVVHCDAGLSRGPTVAWLLGCLLAGPGSEVQQLSAVLAQRPGADVNPWLVALAQRRLRQFDLATAVSKLASCGIRR